EQTDGEVVMQQPVTDFLPPPERGRSASKARRVEKQQRKCGLRRPHPRTPPHKGEGRRCGTWTRMLNDYSMMMNAVAQQAQFNPSPLWGGSAPQAPGWGTAMPHSAITRRTRSQARALRRRPTDAERKLWFLLRSLKPQGLHFRRQAPIGIYIADFVWHEGRLVVELDGSQHVETTAA